MDLDARALDPALLARLPPADRARALELLRTLTGGGEGLVDFVRRTRPHEPPPTHMQVILREIERCRFQRRKLCISVPPRHGKRCADSTPVLTPDGWTTHGELDVGSVVYAPDGTETRVTYRSARGPTDMVVRFADGESVRVHAEHRWTVLRRGLKREEVVETRQMQAAGVMSRDGRKWRARFSVAYTAPLRGRAVALKYEPYVLGYWLGNGARGTGRVTIGPADAEHIEAELRSRVSVGARFVHPATSCVSVDLLGTGLARIEKRIPAQYLTASLSQRRALVAGLVDSDGHVDEETGRVRFVNTDEGLVDDVAALVATLGYRTTITVQPSHTGMANGIPVVGRRDVYTVQWTPHDGVPQGTLPRKALAVRGKRRRRSIVAIEACDVEQGHCLTVDHPSHQYLVGRSLVPTHNTECILNGIAWWLKGSPADTCIYASYSDTQAASKSRLARERAERAGVRLSQSMANLHEWRTSSGGGLLAAGVGGGLTGQGAQGLIIIDDPYKGMAEAQSPTIKQNVRDWFWSVAQFRSEGASTIVIHTRWASDDLIGELVGEKGWEHLCLRAIAEDDDPLGRELGELLWDVRRDEILDAQKGDAWTFAALAQQRPQPRGSTLFREPGRFELAKFDLTGADIRIGVDPAATEDTRADYSVAVAIARKMHEGKLKKFVVGVERVQRELPDVMPLLVRFAQRFGGAPCHVEAVGAFKVVYQTMRRLDRTLALTPVFPQQDKYLRAIPLANEWNAGDVLVPIDAPWARPFLAEFRAFTGTGGRGTKDDQVDATVHASDAFKAPRGRVGSMVIG